MSNNFRKFKLSYVCGETEITVENNKEGDINVKAANAKQTQIEALFNSLDIIQGRTAVIKINH